MNEKVYNADWYGPYKYEHIDQVVGKDPTLVIYAIYGSHPLYGANVLLYLGMTGRSLKQRLDEHLHWTNELSNPVMIYAAAVCEFTTWSVAEATEEYPPLPESDILAIEGLLILAHQPAFNSRSKISSEVSRHVRVFNTGKYGSLLPEVSGLYHVGEIRHRANKGT